MKFLSSISPNFRTFNAKYYYVYMLINRWNHDILMVKTKSAFLVNSGSLKQL